MPNVNLLRPEGSFFKGTARIIFFILAVWFLLVYGFQILLYILGNDAMGTSFLTGVRFLGFPFHYWFTGQFAILGFILLCLLFNRLYDRHLSIHHSSTGAEDHGGN